MTNTDWVVRFSRLPGERKTYMTSENLKTGIVLEHHSFDLTWAESRIVFGKEDDDTQETSEGCAQGADKSSAVDDGADSDEDGRN